MKVINQAMEALENAEWLGGVVLGLFAALVIINAARMCL